MKFKQIDLDYEIDAISHWLRCRDLLENATHIRQVFYASLELRICIERLCFEYLVLLTHRKRDLTKNELAAYKPKDLFSKVLRESPLFSKVVDFVNSVFEVDNVSFRMELPDINWLHKTYGQLGDYLHLQREEMTQAKKIQFVRFVTESFHQIEKYLTRGNISEWPDHAKSIFDKYAAEEITKEQMRKRLEIANIPRHMFNKPLWP
jgi:hypothetical protein